MREMTPLEEIELEPTESVLEEVEEKEVDGVEEDLEPKDEEETKAQDKEKAKKRLSDRLKEQTYNYRESERKNEELRLKIEKLEATKRIKEEPDPDDYADRDDYIRDKKLFTAQEVEDQVNHKLNAEKDRQRQEQANIEINKQTTNYVTKRAEFIKSDEKYREYEKDVDDVVRAYGVPEIQSAVLKGGGPEMVAYLGKNSDELTDIAMMSKEDRLFELGKIAAKVKAKALKTVSSAPNPTRSEKGSATTTKAQSGGSKHSFNKNETFLERARRINGK